MDNSLLSKLGMTQKEAHLYLKLLELGMSGANSLAKRLDENRTSTYSLLQSMQKKGHVSYIDKGGVKYFVPTDPTLLVKHYVDGATALQRALPELLAFYNKSANKPKITFYEGVQGIIQICEQLLEVPDSVRESFMGIELKNAHPEIIKYFEEDFLPRRIANKQVYRGIVCGYLPMSREHPKTEEAQLREIKYIDPQKLPLKIHIDIFPQNKVAIYSYNKDEMMGVIIEHQSFYVTMKTAFALAWAGVDTMKQK
ncbi:hypothetical protein COV82_01105 [Candidatus Peregrinibacteria bacterium CG11_big_fil_rev_8_21_14_0_20_46_8]|nr:MAG: hypothetical protein COV82_01105 [Candidatus Peregrinibacteria bacterium CG11_big_fil_rev_8_21_14_0_20_46_8]